MISYGGIPLSVGDGELHALIERGLDPIGILREFSDPEWTGQEGGWKQADFANRRHPPLYRLYWPRGASRWGEAHFLATEAELDAIRSLAYQPNTSTGLVPLDLKINDGTRSITTAMYMIPPRPLFQVDADLSKGKNLYLLTLVDVRYWWWRRNTAIYVTPGTTTWEQLYGMVGEALGITITVDPIPSEYLKPPIQIQNLYLYIPPMLDAIAYSVGQRIVRALDGTVTAQNADNGIGRQNFQYDLYAKDNINFGGHFRFDRLIQRPDLPPLVPDTVRTIFPQLAVTDARNFADPCDAERCIPGRKYYQKGLTELDIAEYGVGKNVMPGIKMYHSTAIAWLSNLSLTNSVISNADILQALNDQLARDWYLWQLGYMSQVLAGTVPWNATDAEGASDYVEWEATPNKMRTFVMREAMNDLAYKVYHYTPNPGMSDPYPPDPPETVASDCNLTAEVPTTLYCTVTYGTSSVSVAMTYHDEAPFFPWAYRGADVTLCPGLDVREAVLYCDGTIWRFELTVVNYSIAVPNKQDLVISARSDATLIVNSDNPTNMTTDTGAPYGTPCGLEIIYVEITGATVP